MKKDNNLLILLVISIVVLALLWAGYFYLTTRNQGEQVPSSAIAKVGNEYLYDADLQRLITLNGSLASDKTVLTNQLIDESIFLQMGAQENWISLEKSFFNAANKDYSLRQQKVDLVKEAFNDAKTSGTWTNILILRYWFDQETDFIKNNSINAAAQLAENTLKTQIDQVNQENMSFEQAALVLNGYSEYSQKLNPDYGKDAQYFADNDTIQRPNSIYSLRKYPLNLSSVSELNFNIKDEASVLNFFNSAKEGETSALYKIEDRVGDRITNGFYIVFQVKEKRIGYEQNEFDTWLESNKDNFTITKY